MKLGFCRGSKLIHIVIVRVLRGVLRMVFLKKRRGKFVVVYIKWVCHPYVGSAIALPDKHFIPANNSESRQHYTPFAWLAKDWETAAICCHGVLMYTLNAADFQRPNV